MEFAGLFLGIILFFVFFTRALYRRGRISETFSRKILHVVAISLCAVSPWYVPNIVLILIVGITVPILFFLVNRGFFFDEEQQRKSWGIVYFAATFLLLLLLFPKQHEVVFFPMLVLALADGFATIIGTYFGKHPFSFGFEHKSWEGSMAFLVFTLLSFQVIPEFLPFVKPPFESDYVLIIVALFLTFTEALAIKGRDNLWVPIAVAYWILLDTSFINFTSILLAAGLIATIYFTFKKRWLTSGGGVATFLLGCLLLISPQPKWILPSLLFFVVGSLISFLPRRSREASQGGRTAYQVFFNGGVSTLFICCYFLTGQYMFLIGGLSALAASMSDTSSSEIGSRYGRKTFNILTGTLVNPGLSGGVSGIGLAAGFFFTVIFSFISISLTEGFVWAHFVILLVCGMAGNFMDSLLGAILQVKYRADPTSPWSDHPTDSPLQEMMGYKAISNDTVNLLSTIFAAFLGVLLYNLL